MSVLSSVMIAEPYAHPRPISRTGMVFVVALHLLAFWLLLQLQVISLPAPLAVLSVSLIQPAAAIRPEPEVTPPKPEPVEKRPLPMPQPLPLALPAAAPASAPLAQAPAIPVATAPAPAPVAPTAPRFDADYLDNPKPVYPALSRRIGEEGKVVLRVHVLPDGRADDIQLHAASGSPRLDQAALDAVRRWRFVPARQGAQAVAAWVQVPIVFTLKE